MPQPEENFTWMPFYRELALFRLAVPLSVADMKGVQGKIGASENRLREEILRFSET